MSDNGDWDEWIDDNEGNSIKSLFDKAMFKDIRSCIEYDRNMFGFDLEDVRRTCNLDFYSTIKLVNWIRSSELSSDNVLKTITHVKDERIDTIPWSDEKYLTPALPNDSFLQYITMDDDDFSESSQDEAENKIYTLNADERIEQLLLEKGIEHVSINNESIDNELDPYFTSYSYLDIHKEMLKDSVRTLAYRSAILQNSDIFNDSLVMDLGCGSGILSMFSAKAGAKKVYGVDNSSLVPRVRKVIQDNGLDSTVEILQTKIEHLHLDLKVDVLVSEWMGYFLLFEDMLASVIVARDKFLDPKNGKIFPELCTMEIVCANLGEYRSMYEEQMCEPLFWNNVYGFNMNSLLDENDKSQRNAIIDVLPSPANKHVVSDSFTFNEVDMYTITNEELDFEKEFQLSVSSNTVLDAFVIYFDTYFCRDVGTPISFSTSPLATTTHWKQTILLLDSSIKVSAGDVVSGKITAIRLRDSKRCYRIMLSYAINNPDNTCGPIEYLLK